MNKYEPLTKFLENQNSAEIPLTFEKIESVIADKLPASARKYRAWWSNNSGNSVMTHAWIAAGYRSAQVNLEGERVVFLKDPSVASISAPKTTPTSNLFGALAGTVTVTNDVDLTAPVSTEWSEPDL